MVINGDINILLPFVTLLLGAFIGHRLSLGRDKRKDYNQVVIPIRELLITEIRELRSNNYGKPIKEENSIALEAIMPRSIYSNFHQDYQSYKKIRNESFKNDGFGGVFIGDYAKLLSSAEILLRLLPQK